MSLVEKFVNSWPGKRFGVYRFLPIFFVLGAALEFSMIKWRDNKKQLKMLPPGISFGLYIRFTASALFSMLIGAQVVHSYYRPLQDLDKYIDEELKKLPEDQRQKVKLDLH